MYWHKSLQIYVLRNVQISFEANYEILLKDQKERSLKSKESYFTPLNKEKYCEDINSPQLICV